MAQAQAALSDSFVFGAPLVFELTDFTEVKASVLQLTRSPGKPIVYIGCLLLVLGIFAMFYVRERRDVVSLTGQITLVWPPCDPGAAAAVPMSV
jgi:cytochrome c biogenesis protein